MMQSNDAYSNCDSHCMLWQGVTGEDPVGLPMQPRNRRPYFAETIRPPPSTIFKGRYLSFSPVKELIDDIFSFENKTPGF
jgi:hypothetical protein